MDVREGGAWRTVMRNAEGAAHIVSGVYREIAPPRRLVMTWGWEQPDGSRGHETTIELDFEPAPDGTRLRLVQRVFATVGASRRSPHGLEVELRQARGDAGRRRLRRPRPVRLQWAW